MVHFLESLSTAFMLGILTVTSLALYAKATERLARFWASSWHRVVTTVNKCKTKHTRRIQ